ncbi:MAG: hypothetical protein CHACPFDD_01527 [Phycisphaerae bacterium]|nr:hypothetical protein [Phycisphaerae bacterium]
MDRTDPWQPHAIAIATLRTMLRFAPRPRQLALTLDLDRPPWAAAAMLFGGTFWIALAQTIALAAVIAWRASCSPFTALAEAAMAWLPATVLWSLPLHLAGGVLIGMDRGLFSRRPRPAHMFHLATHWAAAQGCWHAFAVVAFVALGDPFLEFGPLVCSALAATPSVLMELRVHGAERRSIRCQRALCYGALALAFGLTTSLLGIWPDTIGPMVALRCLF